MGGTSTISGGELCLRIDPRVPTLSGCAASRGPTIKANATALSMDDDDHSCGMPLNLLWHTLFKGLRNHHLADDATAKMVSTSHGRAARVLGYRFWSRGGRTEGVRRRG
jgi:hypothetical protein